MKKIKRLIRVVALIVFSLLLLVICGKGLVLAAESEGNLAKMVQNPVADLISVPFQFNFNFNYGPDNDVQTILNIQPVIPIHLNAEWNLVTRTIFPVIDQPWPESKFGLGDINISLFFTPAKLKPFAEGGLFWGIGPILGFPTASSDVLGSGKWSAGPAAVFGYLGKTWVVGALANNLWSYAGDANRQSVNLMTVQPFINYNLPDAWYISFSPIITANLSAKGNQQWTVPMGGSVGKIFRIGKLPFNGQLGAYYNVVSPETIGPEYQIRAQIAVLLPGF